MNIVFVREMVVLTALFFGIQFPKNNGMSSVKIIQFRPLIVILKIVVPSVFLVVQSRLYSCVVFDYEVYR